MIIKMKEPEHKMTFDQLQRYRLTAELINSTRKEGRPLVVLDIGSGPGFLDSFLAADRIFSLDRGEFSGGGYLRGDALRIPVKSKSVDVAVSLDLLEHLPASGRINFFDEMDRVSRDYIIIGAPFSGPEIAEGESIARQFFRDITGEENRFLDEHRDEGLPDIQNLVQWCRRKEYRNAVIPNGYLYRWILMMGLNFYLSKLPEPWEYIFAVNEYYHREFYREDNRAPAYRQVAVIDKTNRINVESLINKFTAPPVPAELPSPDLFLKEINRFLELVENDKEIGWSREMGKLERKYSDLQNEKNRIEQELYRMSGELDLTRRQLAAIKATFAYRAYRNTLGRLRGLFRFPSDDGRH